MNTTRRTLGALFLVGLAAGCGYTTGLAPTRPNGAVAKTIGIQMFGNESPLPNLEWKLHAALSDAARRHTALELVDPESAEIVISGKVKAFQRRPGARTTDNRFVETQEVLTVEARALDGWRGDAIAHTQFEVGFGTAIDVPGREPEARANSIRNSADRILLTLLAEVEYGVVRAPLPPDDPEEAAEAP